MAEPRNVYYFGDSIMGQNVETGWAYLHAMRSQAANPELRAHFSIYGGSTSIDVFERMRAELPFGVRKGISEIYVGVGIVDSSEPDENLAFARFRNNLFGILDLGEQADRIIGIGMTRLEAPEVISGGTGNTYNNSVIDRFDDECSDLFEGRRGRIYVPMHDVLVPGDYSDSLHPNERGHQRMMERAWASRSCS